MTAPGARWLRLATLLAAFAALTPACEALARTPSSQVPVGPRAIAMGGAFSAIADDASALFWNPAGLVGVGHQELTASHANLFGVGIREDLASFVLPLSPGFAMATDWYHSGFEDDELGFSENRVTVGTAFKLRPWLWAGTGAKLLTRGTRLDGLSIVSGRGIGFDAGLLVSPTDHWRIGLVGQDLTGTDVRSSEGEVDNAYSRNFRLAAAYTRPGLATAAFDVDDRWHLGLEVTPHALLALRGGAERDREGREDIAWSMGLGFNVGLARIDWARSIPPTLDATDYFSLALEFNFNPAQVRIEKVQTDEIYTSLYKSYARDAFGKVQLRNLQDRPLTTRVSVFIPELMTAPSEQEVTLRPGAVNELPFTAVLDETVLGQRGDRPVQVQVSASYQSKRLVRREKGTARTFAYGPGAINWGEGMAQAAAFVTPRDPAVDALARQAGRLALELENNPFGNRNIAFAAAVTDALAELGVAYVPDPTNPFSTISDTPHAVDTIHYPYQTLDRLSGDCDDTTVLMASMLGNLGVKTQFVDVPGHILLLADTGLHERNRAALGVDSTLMVIDGDRVWIPLETTSLAKGFVRAWRDGADGIASGAATNRVQYFDVTQAQVRFEPATPPGERNVRKLVEERFNARLQAEAKEVSSIREQYFTARFGASARELEATAGALEEVSRIEFEGGNLEGARSQLRRALAKAPQSASAHNNLGVVLAGMDSSAIADEHWQAALALGRRDPGIALNRGIVRWARGDSAGAMSLLGPAVAEAGGYAAACRLVGLDPDGTRDAADDFSDQVLTLRSGIRTVLRQSESAGKEQGRVSGPPPSTLTIPNLSPSELSKYLYWIE